MASENSPKKKKSLIGRIFKWTGITFVLLLISAIVLPFLFKDKIVEMAKSEVNKNLNAKVSWGDFDLSLISSFPSFRFSISDVKVIGINEFANDTLASIPQLKLDLDLMSVIKGDQYKVNSISLDKPRILAKVLFDGKANWDITKPDSSATPTAPSSEPTKFKLSLKELEIKNAYIVYDDVSLATKTVLDNMSYTLNGDFTQDNFVMKNVLDIEKFTLDYDGMTYLSKVKTGLKADLDMDMVNWKFTFKENEINLNELGFGIDGFFAMPGEDYNMDMKFKAKQSEFKSFLSLIPGAYTKDFSNVKATGKLAFDGYLKGLYSEKQNKMPGYGLNFQITDGFVQYPDVPKPISAINIDCKIDDASGVTDETKIDLNKCHIDFGGNPVDAGLHVSTPVSDANMDGWLKCKIDLATLKDVMPLEKDEELNGKVNADVKMKGRMSQIEKEQYDQFDCSGNVEVMDMLYKSKTVGYDMNIKTMKMNFSPAFVVLNSFDGLLGKNDIRADGRMDNLMAYLFKDSLLHGNFNMNSTVMDLNVFAGEEDASAPTAEDSAALTIIEVPGNIDFTLNSNIGKLIYDDITMTEVIGKILVKKSAVYLDHLKMKLMGGSMDMSGMYSTINPAVPNVDFKMNITDFDIQQTFKTFNTVQKLAPVSKYSQGRFSTSLEYKGDLGSDMMPKLETVHGKGVLSTKQVVVTGFEPLKKLDDALKLNKFKSVTINDLNAVSFTIEDGRVTTEPFDFKVGKSAGKMGGSTGLDQSIKYVMDIAIPRAEFGPANTALKGMESAVQAKGIPLKVGDVVNVQALFAGTTTNPTVTTNLKEAGGNLIDNLKDTIKGTIIHKVDSVKTVGINKACEEAQKQLDQAVKKAAEIKASAYKLADDAHTAAFTEADKLEKSYKNPLEKAAKKAAADAARKAADNKQKDAKAAADKAEKDAIAKAEAEKANKCK
jgi:AsmA-like C-terminal region/AsmA family